MADRDSKRSKQTVAERPVGRAPVAKRESKGPGRETAVVADTLGEATPIEGRIADALEFDDERYAVTDEIARGGMGRVLAARDRRLGRTVALKEALGETADDLARFDREVQITARLQHPSILPLYDARQWPSGAPYYVMRLVHGEPLSEQIAAAGSLDERLTLLPSMLAAADALASAHQAGIIHRDVKPGNILVGEHGETVLIDWGIAKTLYEDDEADEGRKEASEDDEGRKEASEDHRRAPETSVDATRPGAILGTPGYMAPEQIVGDPADERSDVYALGATLYCLLGGERPFGSESSELIMARQLVGPPDSLALRVKGVPRELLTILDRALARDPADRYPNAAAFASDLRSFQTGRLVSAHDYSVGERVLRFVRKHRSTVIVIALAFALIVAIGASSIHRISTERDLVVSASERAADRADQLYISRARRLLERGNGTGAVAMLKHIRPETQQADNARLVLDAARRQGVRTTELGAHKSWITLAWHPREALLLSAGDKVVLLHDFRAARPTTRTLAALDTYVFGAVFIDQHRAVAFAGEKPGIVSIDLESGARREYPTRAPIVSLAASPRGDRLVWLDKDATVWSRTLAPEAEAVELGAAGPIGEVTISDNGELIAVSNLSGPALLLRGGVRHEVIEGGYNPLLSPDGRSAIFLFGAGVVEYTVGEDGPIEVQRWPASWPTEIKRGQSGRLTLSDSGQILDLAAGGEVGVVQKSAGAARLFSTAVGLVTFDGATLTLVDQGRSQLALPSESTQLSTVAAGHGRLAIGERTGRLAIYVLADVVSQSLDLGLETFLHFGGGDVLFSDELKLRRVEGRTREIDTVAVLDAPPSDLRTTAHGDLALNVAGPYSQVVRLSDGKTEAVNLFSGLVGARYVTYLRDERIFRYEPFANKAIEPVFTADAGTTVAVFTARGRDVAIATADGVITLRAGADDERRVEIGAPVSLLALAENGDCVFAVGSEIFRVGRLAPVHLATLPSHARDLYFSEGNIIAVSVAEVTRIGGGGKVTTIEVDRIHENAKLAHSRLAVRNSRGEVLLVDFGRERASPITNREPPVISIVSDGTSVLSLARRGGRMETYELPADRGATTLRADLEQATAATIDLDSGELGWP